MRDLKQILQENNFKFNKAYGQNFITDTNLLMSIVSDAEITKEDTVIEIGPGGGTLTRELAKACKKVIAFEIDKNLQPVLLETLAEFDNVEVFFEDILKVDMGRINRMTGGQYKVVANLPYYITTPIIMHFIEQDTPPKSLTVMVQKEVAERFCAKENTADYGSITVAIRSRGHAKITRIVKRQVFYPVPNVDSAIVRIDLNAEYDIADRRLFQRLYKAAFQMRRKTLVNNLIAAFELPRERAESILTDCGIDIRARGESLGVEKFIELSVKLCEYI